MIPAILHVPCPSKNCHIQRLEDPWLELRILIQNNKLPGAIWDCNADSLALGA